jgi:hypothetical protein
MVVEELDVVVAEGRRRRGADLADADRQVKVQA